MSLKFCTDCKNLLIDSTDNNILTFICRICQKEFKSTDADTLRKKVNLQTSQSSLYKYETFIKLAVGDAAVQRIDKKCENPKCDETILKVITISDNMQFIYVCPKCQRLFSM
jgi:DNA-directed RNA polymerase subunit M/transcription elongation factor TFIIS